MRAIFTRGAVLARAAIALAIITASVNCGGKSMKDGGSTGASAGARQLVATPPNCANPGGIPGIAGGGPNIVGNLPTFDGQSDSKVVAGGIKLKITVPAHVSAVPVGCMPTTGYVVAKIEYDDNGTATMPWNGWGRADGAAYLYVHGIPSGAHVPANTADFHYQILKIQNNAAVPVWQGFGFAYPDSGHQDQVAWGVPQWHASDTNFNSRYQQVAALDHGPIVNAMYDSMARGLGARPDTGVGKRDIVPGDTWFSCDQGCCNVTSVY